MLLGCIPLSGAVKGEVGQLHFLHLLYACAAHYSCISSPYLSTNQRPLIVVTLRESYLNPCWLSHLSHTHHVPRTHPCMLTHLESRTSRCVSQTGTCSTSSRRASSLRTACICGFRSCIALDLFCCSLLVASFICRFACVFVCVFVCVCVCVRACVRACVCVCVCACV